MPAPAENIQRLFFQPANVASDFPHLSSNTTKKCERKLRKLIGVRGRDGSTVKHLAISVSVNRKATSLRLNLQATENDICDQSNLRTVYRSSMVCTKTKLFIQSAQLFLCKTIVHSSKSLSRNIWNVLLTKSTSDLSLSLSRAESSMSTLSAQ